MSLNVVDNATFVTHHLEMLIDCVTAGVVIVFESDTLQVE